jgi:hypothetical protein
MESIAAPVDPVPPEPPAARTRRRWFSWPWVLLAILCVAVLGVGYVLVALKQEPEFYRISRTRLADPAVRTAAVEEFTAQAEELEQAVTREAAWRVEFTEDQINAWLLDELPRRIRERDRRFVQDPLVDLSAGTVQIGARIDAPDYRGVVSVAVKPTIEPDSKLLVEIEAIRAGQLTIPAIRWLGQFRKQLEESGWPVEIVSESPLQLRVDLRAIGPAWKALDVAELSIENDKLALAGSPMPNSP